MNRNDRMNDNRRNNNDKHKLGLNGDVYFSCDEVN